MTEENIEKIYKECYGCAVRHLCSRNYKEGSYKDDFKNGIRDCPCKRCLLKMCCSEICEEYDKAWQR